MKTRLKKVFESLHSSYWFIPSLMSVATVGLAFLTVYVDEHLTYEQVSKVQWLWAGGAEGARQVLSTIAGSMITVAGVSFSVTIVSMTLASQQFGPRLLRSFMRDTGNQIVLGTFIATYLYCLLVMRRVTNAHDHSFVPYVSVTCGLAFAVANLGVLIFFIHHVCESIQAENLVASVAQELHGKIREIFRQNRGAADTNGAAKATGEELPDDFEEGSAQVTADNSGYLQAVEVETILRAAEECDLLIRIQCRPGDFVIEGSPLGQVWPSDRCDDGVRHRLCSAFIVGRRRTPTQDVEYCVYQLVEIAVRAISPGINDPFTAVNCVEWLGAALAQLAAREIPSSRWHGAGNRLRIIAPRTSFAEVADASFNQIREYGKRSTVVTACLLKTIGRIAEHLRCESDREHLRHHAQAIRGSFRGSSPDERDLKDVEQEFAEAIRQLDAVPPRATAGNR